MGADSLGSLPLNGLSDMTPQSPKRPGWTFYGQACCGRVSITMGFGKIFTACPIHPPMICTPGNGCMVLELELEATPVKLLYTSTFEEDDPWMKP